MARSWLASFLLYLRLPLSHADLQWALKIEPKNDAVRAELARVDELILSGKGKTVRSLALLFLYLKQQIQRTVPAEIPAPPLASSTSPATAPPKRRRVPITIVDSDASSEPTNDLLSPISSRLISKPADAEAGPTPKPELASSFKEAKQVRDEKKAGRVGGGIFRVSGNDTVFKTRQVPAPKDPPRPSAPAPSPASVTATRDSGSASTSSASPRTLFEFTRAWDSIPASDTASRWTLLNVRSPSSTYIKKNPNPDASQTVPASSLPAFFGASLEPALLASLIPVLAEAAPPTDAREFMCALARVSRFRTVARFLSASERGAASTLWEAVVLGAGDAQDADRAEAARAWGFTEQ